MTGNPLVSVVCPAYNCAQFIASALESVLAQSYKPLEIIIVDDGSTDSTCALVRGYPDIRYIHQTNRGPSAARNAGIASARGEYIAFLDLDDLWASGKVAEQLAILESHPRAGLCFTDMYLFTDGTIREDSMFQRYRLTEQYFGHEKVVRNPVAKLVTMNFIPTSSVIARKTALLQAGGFDEKFRKAEDWDLWLRLAIRHPIVYSHKALVLKRLHEFNTSNDYEGMNVAALQVLEKFKKDNRAEVTKLNIDLMAILRDGYQNLGYYYLRQICLAEAREAFQRSLSLGFRARALVYFLATFLGPGFVGSIVRARG